MNNKQKCVHGDIKLLNCNVTIIMHNYVGNGYN